jgi:hypothetical protein
VVATALPANMSGEYSSMSTRYQPSSLSWSAYKNALRKGFSVSSDVTVDLGDHQKVVDYLCEKYRRKLAGSGLTGLEDVLKDIDMTTSPGFPWSMLPGVSNKSDLLNHKRYAPIFLNWLSVFPKAAAEGGHVTIWSMFLKSEMRESSKVRSNATRAVYSSDFAYTIWMNILCKEFNNGFYDLCLNENYNTAVGVSPFSGGWHALACQTILKCDNEPFEYVFSGDVGAFDFHVQNILQSGDTQIRVACSDWNARTRRFYEHLVWENTHGLLACYDNEKNGVVVMTGIYTKSFQKSGSPNTATSNTIMHDIVTTHLYKKCDANEGSDYKRKIYSDDNVAGVNHHVACYLDDYAHEHYKGYGMNLRLPDGNSSFLTDPDGASFLSARFVKTRHGYAYQHSNPDKILSSLMWSHGNVSMSDRFAKVCSLRMLAYGDKELFEFVDQVARSLLPIMKAAKADVGSYLSTDSLDKLFFGHEGGVPFNTKQVCQSLERTITEWNL